MNWFNAIGSLFVSIWNAWQESKKESEKTYEEKAKENQQQADTVVDKAKEANQKEMDNIINKIKG